MTGQGLLNGRAETDSGQWHVVHLSRKAISRHRYLYGVHSFVGVDSKLNFHPSDVTGSHPIPLIFRTT